MSAVDSLLALHTAGEDWEAVIETLQSKASLLEEPLEQAAILKEAGAIASEHSKNPNSRSRSSKIFEVLCPRTSRFWTRWRSSGPHRGLGSAC